MLAIQNQRTDIKNNIVTQKTSKAKPRPPTLSKSLEVKAGPTAMEKVLKQTLCKVIIYENKLRPVERGRSQNTASEGWKNFYKYMLQLAWYVYVNTNNNARNMYQHKNWASVKYLT